MTPERTPTPDGKSLLHEDGRFSKATTRIAAGVFLLAVGVLVGWLLGVEPLKRIFPHLVAMNPVTAVALALTATALHLSVAPEAKAWAKPSVRVLATIVIGVGTLQLTSAFGRWDLGIDQLLFPEKLAEAGSVWPNRMAPNTAFNFVVIGCALLLLDKTTQGGRRPSGYFIFLALISSILPVLGYVYGVESFYVVSRFIPMALHTAAAFLFLCVGLVLARPGVGLAALLRSSTEGGVMARRLLPAALLIPVVIGWLRLTGERAGLFTGPQGVALVAVANMVLFG